MKALTICLYLIAPSLALATNSESLSLEGGLPGGTEQAVVVGDHAFCAASSGLLVLDVADPAQMAQVALLQLEGWGRRLAVAEGLAFVAPHGGDLTVVDVSEPAAPVVLGACPELRYGGGVATAGDLVFVADMALGFAVVDVADPASPALVASLPLAGEFHGLALTGDLALVAADDDGLHVIDVADPLAPSLLSTVSFPGVVRGVAADGDLAYLAAGSSGLRILDLSDPAQPVQLSQLQLYYDYSWALFARAVSVADGLACLGIGHYGLGLVDVSDPTLPVEVVLHEIPGDAISSDRHGELAYVAMYHGGLAALDLGDPSAPVDLGRFGLLGDAADLAVADGLVYVAGGYGTPEEKQGRAAYLAGLFVVDPTDPAAAAVVGYGATWYQSPRLTVAGDRAFISVPFCGIRIFDVADPTAPVELGWVPTTAEMYKVAVDGDLLFNYQGNDFVVTDVSDPARPETVGFLETGYYGHLTADRGFVYSVSGIGLRVIDVRDPAHPAQVAQLPISGSASATELVGGHIHIANGHNGLLVVDVRDPMNPVVAGQCPLPGVTQGMACRWPFAYAASYDYDTDLGSIHAIDVSDPAAPVAVASTDFDHWALAVAVEGTRVYAAGGWGGLLVYEHDVTTGTLAPVPTALRQNHPNPFNPRTTIRWDQAVAGPVELAVFDLAGRRVRTLVDGERGAGRQRAAWDGRDERGRAVSAGVYLYRLCSGDVKESRTMVLVR